MLKKTILPLLLLTSCFYATSYTMEHGESERSASKIITTADLIRQVRAAHSIDELQRICNGAIEFPRNESDLALLKTKIINSIAAETCRKPLPTLPGRRHFTGRFHTVDGRSGEVKEKTEERELLTEVQELLTQKDTISKNLDDLRTEAEVTQDRMIDLVERNAGLEQFAEEALTTIEQLENDIEALKRSDLEQKEKNAQLRSIIRELREIIKRNPPQ